MTDDFEHIGEEVQSQLEDLREVEETSDTAKMPVDWSFDPESLKSMAPEQRQQYEIEAAEKIRRLHAGLEGLGNILTANGIRYEGETPREILDKLFNPDKYALKPEDPATEEPKT